MFHAIQYLSGRQSKANLEKFRAFGGAQAYPSRTKDHDDVDFSTGSIGLGVGVTVFASLVQDYLRLKKIINPQNPPGRMVALAGDAELDEGNIFEALFEGWKHDVRNVWWVIDYNRQSLDNIVEDRLFNRIDSLFQSMGWTVHLLKYGKKFQKAFDRPGGEALRHWMDHCPNSLYSALVYQGGESWRKRLLDDLGDTAGIKELLDEHDDHQLHQLMTNLAGHDMQTVLEAFHSVKDDAPCCFIAYTIKGYGLPFAGHKDNHAGLLSKPQMQQFKKSMNIAEGREWEFFAGPDLPQAQLEQFVSQAPFAQSPSRRHDAPLVEIPTRFETPKGDVMSTQVGFGRLLNELGQGSSRLAQRIVTTSPDVTVSTNLGPWVNHRGIFDRRSRKDIFHDQGVSSTQQWRISPEGQHIELGIAENNLFLLLGSLGLSGSLFGQRLFPIGTIYDPFISRGLDALNYACYQGARFLLVGTPAGITLAPEGGAHQSIITPLIGMGQPGLTFFEPTYVDELAVILAWCFKHMQDEKGGSVYLRLSTRPIEQQQRSMTDRLRDDILAGGYWLIPPQPGATLAVVCCGAVTAQAIAGYHDVKEDVPGLGLLVVTSADRLHADWLQTRQQVGSHPQSSIERLLGTLSPDATLVTLLDGHPLTLSWLGSVARHHMIPLGVDRFGQSGSIRELYREYRLDQQAIIDAIASACMEQCY